MLTTETPQEQLSRLFGSYKAEWLKEQLFELFTEPAYFPDLKTARPCVLEGGRGTGKTTVLKGLSYEGQFALSGKNKDAIEEWRFIGLYYRVNTNRVTAFKGRELAFSEWTRLFAHYFNVLICGLVLDFLHWYYEHFPEAEEISQPECINIATSLHLPECQSWRELSIRLDAERTRFEACVNNVADHKEFSLSMQGAPIDALTSAVLRLAHFTNKQFYILIDEYENLEDYQQQIVNTLIKHTTDDYTFKVGVRELGWRQRTTLNINEKLISPADYVLIPIAAKLEGERFTSFAQNVCNTRVSHVQLPEGRSITDVRQVLASLTEDEEAGRLGVDDAAEAIRREVDAELDSDERTFLDALKPLEVYFLQFWAQDNVLGVSENLRDWRRNPKQWEERYQNYKHALLYTIRKGKRGIHKYYAGWEVLTRMAAGNIRYLLELVDQSFLAHLQEGNELGEHITPETQTLTAQNVGKKNLSELEGLTIHGAQLTKLLLGLGRIFQVMAADAAGHSPEINQFEIKATANLTLAERAYVNQILIAAVMHLALLRAPGNKLGDVGDTKDYDYMIHPIFSAFFEYSYRRKRKLSIEEAEIAGLIQEPTKTIRDILRRHNRRQDETLPQQLLLFQNYYEG